MQHRLFTRICNGQESTPLLNGTKGGFSSPSTKTLGEQDYLECIFQNSSRKTWFNAQSMISNDNSGSIATQTSSTPFTTDEFARIVVLLSSNEEIRDATLEFVCERTRQQLNQRIPRNSFWSTLVAPVSNYATMRPQFVIITELTDIVRDRRGAYEPVKIWRIITWLSGRIVRWHMSDSLSRSKTTPKIHRLLFEEEIHREHVYNG